MQKTVIVVLMMIRKKSIYLIFQNIIINIFFFLFRNNNNNNNNRTTTTRSSSLSLHHSLRAVVGLDNIVDHSRKSYIGPEPLFVVVSLAFSQSVAWPGSTLIGQFPLRVVHWWFTSPKYTRP